MRRARPKQQPKSGIIISPHYDPGVSEDSGDDETSRGKPFYTRTPEQIAADAIHRLRRGAGGLGGPVGSGGGGGSRGVPSASTLSSAPPPAPHYASHPVRAGGGAGGSRLAPPPAPPPAPYGGGSGGGGGAGGSSFGPATSVGPSDHPSHETLPLSTLPPHLQAPGLQADYPRHPHPYLHQSQQIGDHHSFGDNVSPSHQADAQPISSSPLATTGNAVYITQAIRQSFASLQGNQARDTAIMIYLGDIRLKLFVDGNGTQQIEIISYHRTAVGKSFTKTNQFSSRINVDTLSDDQLANTLIQKFTDLGYDIQTLGNACSTLTPVHANGPISYVAGKVFENSVLCYGSDTTLLDFNDLNAINSQIDNLMTHSECSQDRNFLTFAQSFKQCQEEKEKENDSYYFNALAVLSQLFIVDHRNISQPFQKLRAFLQGRFKDNQQKLNILRHIADSSFTEEAHNARLGFEKDSSDKLALRSATFKITRVDNFSADHHVQALHDFKNSEALHGHPNISGFSIFVRIDPSDQKKYYEVSLMHKRTYVDGDYKDVSYKHEILTGYEALNFARLTDLATSSQLGGCSLQSYNSTFFDVAVRNNDKDSLFLNTKDFDHEQFLDSQLAHVQCLTQQNINRSPFQDIGPNQIEAVVQSQPYKFANPVRRNRPVQPGISCERIDGDVYVRRVYSSDNPREIPNIQWVVLKYEDGSPYLDTSGNAYFVKVEFERNNIKIDNQKIYLAKNNTNKKMPMQINRADDTVRSLFHNLNIIAQTCSEEDPENFSTFKLVGGKTSYPLKEHNPTNYQLSIPEPYDDNETLGFDDVRMLQPESHINEINQESAYRYYRELLSRGGREREEEEEGGGGGIERGREGGREGEGEGEGGIGRKDSRRQPLPSPSSRSKLGFRRRFTERLGGGGSAVRGGGGRPPGGLG